MVANLSSKIYNHRIRRRRKSVTNPGKRKFWVRGVKIGNFVRKEKCKVVQDLSQQYNDHLWLAGWQGEKVKECDTQFPTIIVNIFTNAECQIICSTRTGSIQNWGLISLHGCKN